jgi:hypothetical protein
VIEVMKEANLKRNAQLCGRVLARAHGRDLGRTGRQCICDDARFGSNATENSRRRGETRFPEPSPIGDRW